MRASAIRALFAVANRPEVVSLAGGMPYLRSLPLESLAAEAAALVARDGLVALQYGSGQGIAELREQICQVMALEGIKAHPDDVMVTVGSQMALDLTTRIFVDPGDVILAEAPSYVGALGTFHSYQAQVVHVGMDDDGLIPEALVAAIESCRAAGRRVKLLYTIPNFHNPAGVTLSDGRRAQIADICRRSGIAILEDNPYGLLGFDDRLCRAIRADDADNVIYLGSFSKTFAPGLLRVGWVLARTHWTNPDAGFHVWMTLPEGFDAAAMLPRAVTARVAYVPGNGFYADGLGTRQLRLSYCFPPERIAEGIRRLAGVLSGERLHEAMRDVGLDVAQRDADTELIGWLTEHRPDAAIVALHGSRGESGAIQSVLEMAGIAYVGAVSTNCRLPYEKNIAKNLMRRAGFATSSWVSLSHSAF